MINLNCNSHYNCPQNLGFSLLLTIIWRALLRYLALSLVKSIFVAKRSTWLIIPSELTIGLPVSESYIVGLSDLSRLLFPHTRALFLAAMKESRQSFSAVFITYTGSSCWPFPIWMKTSSIGKYLADTSTSARCVAISIRYYITIVIRLYLILYFYYQNKEPPHFHLFVYSTHLLILVFL